MVIPLLTINNNLEGKTIIYPPMVSVVYYAAPTDLSYNNITGSASSFYIRNGILYGDINLSFKHNMLAGLTIEQINTIFNIVLIGFTIRPGTNGSILIVDLKAISIYKKDV